PYQGHRGTGFAGPLVSPPGRVGTDDTQCVWAGVRTFMGGHIRPRRTTQPAQQITQKIKVTVSATLKG
ncbi:MAG: hypothetical protein ORN28_02215, partial [Rhodoferax sp.]|nr:hypothetical protein [Rhodoferax sp.]